MLIVLHGACGAIYVSPRVDERAENVVVRQLTGATIDAANAVAYVPRDVPAAFRASVAVPDSVSRTADAPEPSLQPADRPATMAMRLPPATAPEPYRIGVGDVVILSTRTSGGTVEELTGLLAAQNRRQGYTVQDDGAIAVPDVGRIQLAELTLEEAEAVLFQRLVESRIEPTFSLEIAEFNARRVALGGAVAAPVVIPVTLSPLYLDAALAQAGGIATPDFDYASIRLYRDGALYQIPLSTYLGEPALQKLRLQDGDSVFVDTAFALDRAQAYFEEQIVLAQFRQAARQQALAELTTEVALRRAALTERRTGFQDLIALDAVPRDYVYLAGEVSNPSRFTMPFGRQTTLADALYAEGGFSAETGNPSQIYVLRAQDGSLRVTAWHLDARNVANLVLATRMNLLPNDIVFVAEQPVTRWNRVVQQIIPSLITGGAGLAAN